LAYFSQPAHASADDDRTAYRAWILALIEQIWTRFETGFLDLWRHHRSELLPPTLAPESAAAERLYRRRMASVLADTAGFAGAKMIRRLMGISHVEDFEAIASQDRRAQCEAAALSFARELMVRRAHFRSIGALTEEARQR